MRRYMVLAVVGLLLAIGFNGGNVVAPAYAAPDVSVKVDGKLVGFPDQLPYIDSNDRTMVPVRSPMEAMGCHVDWNDQARQATITKGGTTAVFTIGSNTYTVNGQNKTMDTQAVITGDRTAFPIRFAAEAMGARVEWDASTYTVNIYTQDTGVKQVTIDCYKLNDRTEFKNCPEFDIAAWPLAVKFVSIDEKEYRFVCTSHEGLNTALVAPFGQKQKVEMKTDGECYGQHTIANGLGYLTEIKSGMTIEYDIYNEAGDKLYEMTFQM
jgi:hypothetical protein